LLPVIVTKALIEKVRSEMPELPQARVDRFVTKMGLPQYDAEVLTVDREVADYFEVVAKECGNAKSASNWIMTELLRELNAANRTIVNSPISALALGQMIALVEKGTISGKIGKTVFAEMWTSGKNAETIIKDKGLGQVSDAGALGKIIDEVIAANAGQVADYRGGKVKLFGFFVGAVMKASKGQANPEMVNQLLTEKLKG
jgi:aspartyl-tRNA(Asn)/glutamyl-tRNA(Gln) amidotransferase subunit B